MKKGEVFLLSSLLSIGQTPWQVFIYVFIIYLFMSFLVIPTPYGSTQARNGIPARAAATLDHNPLCHSGNSKKFLPVYYH